MLRATTLAIALPAADLARSVCTFSGPSAGVGALAPGTAGGRLTATLWCWAAGTSGLTRDFGAVAGVVARSSTPEVLAASAGVAGASGEGATVDAAAVICLVLGCPVGVADTPLLAAAAVTRATADCAAPGVVGASGVLATVAAGTGGATAAVAGALRPDASVVVAGPRAVLTAARFCVCTRRAETGTWAAASLQVCSGVGMYSDDVSG